MCIHNIGIHLGIYCKRGNVCKNLRIRVIAFGIYLATEVQREGTPLTTSGVVVCAQR